MNKENSLTPMLNLYPDSMGGTLKDVTQFLASDDLKDSFGSIYILPSIYNTDLDRGFSVIDYNINELFASEEDLEKIKALGLDLKLDFILNHASVLSPQFQDLLENGQKSKYKDFFINWNEFWTGCGKMTTDGYIQPEKKYLDKMFFRKPGLPILMVRMPDGSKIPYWNTFYQKVFYDPIDAQDLLKQFGMQYASAEELADLVNKQLKENVNPADMNLGRWANMHNEICDYLDSRCKYLGQMDLNLKSPLVWDFYKNTLQKLAGYGAAIIRLDAFAYAPKAPGSHNFMNEPETWNTLERVRELAAPYGLTLLPEIHASYEEKTYEKVANYGYLTYDFFLPGLLIDAIEQKDGTTLAGWANELIEKHIVTVNMLGCHDGIPLLDLRGLLPEERIAGLIDLIVARGGFVKNLHGQKNVYYQVNATYYSALGEDDRKMLVARAIQLFMPGKPQVWYLDLFAGKNDHEAVAKAGEGGHKEINRTNLTIEQIHSALTQDVVKKQIELLRFRKSSRAFTSNAKISVISNKNNMHFIWQGNTTAELSVDFTTMSYEVKRKRLYYDERLIAMREVLTVRVRIKETYEVHGQRGLARMILFDGEGEGSGFYGKILPGGVDTQQVHDDGKLELSARYMLEGTDGSGKSCLVFIENVGIANDKGYIEKTHPKIRTNSTTLSWLETSVLLGTISAWEKGVIIHIYLSSQ